ncbi:MAG: hypothetical protein ABJC26_02810 [Gemmatimonadaceae bacterium]
MNSRIHRITVVALTLCGAILAASCAGTPTGGPDALPPESFELSLVNSQTPPYKAYNLALAGSVWIRSARIKSIVAGRTIDPRIFDDRSGNGTSGGNSRDSTTAAAEVSDIREFDEHAGSTISSTIVGTHTDTSSATIERRGDLLIITRSAPIPSRVVVDTAQFIDGKLVVTVHEWERFGVNVTNTQFIYAITKQ